MSEYCYSANDSADEEGLYPLPDEGLDDDDEDEDIDFDEIPTEEVVDRSGEPDAEEKALDFKVKGNEELGKGHFLQAVEMYTKGLEYQPTNSILLSNRALAYIKLENYGLALQDSDHAIQFDPKYAKGYYRRASANFALHHFKLARKDFRLVCKLQPTSKDSRAKLAQVEKEIREEAFAKAIEADQTAPLSQSFDPSSIYIASTYDGPHPDSNGLELSDMDAEASLFEPGNLPREFVMQSCQYFKDQKLINRRYVARILLSCRKYLAALPSLVEIRIPDNPPPMSDTAAPRVTVCGDTHGQYYDVLNIFEMNGWPDVNNPYLFNGDFVDRGSFSVEVILSFLLWKLYDPACIYLSRGNHETKNMNRCVTGVSEQTECIIESLSHSFPSLCFFIRIYGFEGEVKAKYDDKIYQLFVEVFEWLPLAATIENKVFVTHGGLPVKSGITLDDICRVKRGVEPFETGLMSDLLWSDPQPFPGKAPSKRGVGFSFGPNITAAFLKRNNLDLLVRSHEVKEEGYLVEHEGKTITVFSAPNYCDTMGNKGAFIRFDKSLEPKFTQFEAVPHPNVKPMAYAAGMGGMF